MLEEITMSVSRRLTSTFLVLLAMAGLAYGQAVSGSLLGTVTDASGATVPGAKVTLTAVQTNISRSMNSNESGNFVFPNVEPGTYKVAVELKGFRTAIKDGIDVLVNTTVRADLTLQPGAVNESVTVTAEVALLQTDRSDTGRRRGRG
ncbi:MAG: carboxypeptidase regulatory-like domain-containing protein, partial [Acidobacteria bacterium]|nr:carboxypeptidase regulatory-like domain-containing protein [Acidobacteriota bacterium]